MAVLAEQETAQKLDTLSTGDSTEAGDVSEATETTDAAAEDNATAESEAQETDSAEATTEAPAAKAPKELTPEQRRQADIQAAVDKQVNKYRDTREADTAMIRRQADEIKRLKSANATKESGKRLTKLLESYDEEGRAPEEKEAFAEQVKKINAEVADYNAKVDSINETAAFIAEISKRIPENVVKTYKLDDPNPAVRARNGAELLEEAASTYTKNQNFLMAVEAFFPKGAEVRKQIEDIVNDLADPELSTEKAKRLFLEQRTKGLNLSPKKTPPTPSGSNTGGSQKWFNESQIADRAFWEANKDAIIEAQAAGRIRMGR